MDPDWQIAFIHIHAFWNAYQYLGSLSILPYTAVLNEGITGVGKL